FSLRPLAAALELEAALRNVMGNAIPGDACQRVRGRSEVACFASDDDTEFDLPVRLLAAAWQQDIIVRADDRVRALEEDHGFGWHGHAGFGRMIGVVETDADQLAGTCHA